LHESLEGRTFSDVPSENVAASQDRRTRKRDARRDHLLDLASDLVETVGVDGVTMAALAEAADYAPASLYTYFASRSALLAALQQRALAVLGAVAQGHLAAWDRALADRPVAVTDRVASLARLVAFSELFLAAPHDHPREFRLQQQLLVSVGAEDTADAATVVPAAMVVLDAPRRLLAAAESTGALHSQGPLADPIDEPIDGALVRTFVWIVALNGALMADGLTTGLPTTGTALGRVLTDTLLRGWGADGAELDDAHRVAQDLSRSATGGDPR
jgi:AcrR family transcriptional regulator